MKIFRKILLLTLVVASIVLISNSVHGLFAAPKRAFDFSKIPASDYVHNEVLVKYRGDKGFTRMKLPADQTVPEIVKELNNRRDVEYAEPNFVAFALDIPNDLLYEDTNRDPNLYPEYTDPKYAQQWALNNTQKTGGTRDADVDWQEAYTYLQGTTCDTTVVAVIDSGLDVKHPDLDDKVAGTYSVLNGSYDVSDDYGHGTHVSGTALAETNNTVGVAGVGYDQAIKLLVIKVLDRNGRGSNGDIADGIKYAANWKGIAGEKIKVINLSLGSYYDTQAVHDEINNAWNKGIVIVAAAGNSEDSSLVYPAYYERVISVGATDRNDLIAGFSTHNDGVDVSAPGVEVLSTFPTHRFTIQRLYGRMLNYDVGSGTSMASPHVAGLAALLFSIDGSRSNDQVRSMIESSVDDLGNTGWDSYYGHGRINAYKAITGPVPTPEPTIEPTPTPEPTITPTPSPTPTPGTGSCGDGYCAGYLEGEDCFSCPEDCRGTGQNNSRSCCGDGQCIGENVNQCQVDCQ
ncbi:S8 family peptidase [Patescibacteria group bacterium]|nr:S8 family peptidase [Patescibacteria group bacterium]MBU1868215.1 S8 family peptidase [Patescibacteria group bacterium]